MVVIMFTLFVCLLDCFRLFTCIRVGTDYSVPEWLISNPYQRWAGTSARPRRQADQVARPWRSSLPGVSPLHLPSAKVSTPLTRIDR